MSVQSHSTLVPADSMIASAPHVRVPARLHATIGKVPLGARWPSGGGRSSRHTSSIAPVPNVIFVIPGSMQPCPTSDACWSPTRAAIGGAPGSAVAETHLDGGVDDRGQDRARHTERLAHAGVPRALLHRVEPGDRCVGVVGDVHGTFRQRPREPRVDRAEAELGRVAPGRGVREQPPDLRGRLVGCEVDAVLRLRHDALAHGAQVLPAERRADRAAGCSLPHDGGRTLVGDAHPRHHLAVGLRQRRASRVEDERRESGRVEFDEAGER
jgi:hypothetical protein